MKNVVKNTVLLTASSVFVLLAGFGIKTIQTRILTPEEYGYYAFFGSLMAILIILSRAGFFTSLQVILAEKEFESHQRSFLSIGFWFTLILACLSSALLFAIAPLISELFRVEMTSILRAVAPISGILYFRLYISAAALGTGKPSWLASYDIISKALFLLLLLIGWQSIEWSVQSLIYANIITLAIPLILVLLFIRPTWHVENEARHLLKRKWKQHGLQFYYGSIVNQATYKTDELFISYFINTTVNGFYTLAILLSSPLIIGSQALSDSLFKDFSQSKRIPPRVFVLNLIYLILGLTSLYLLAPVLVELLFGSEYSDVATYARGLLFAIFFQGLYQPFNFLTAKSQGRTIKRIAFMEGGVSLLGNIICIPIFGIWGAIGTSIFAKFVHFIAKTIAYRNYIRNEVSAK